MFSQRANLIVSNSGTSFNLALKGDTMYVGCVNNQGKGGDYNAFKLLRCRAFEADGLD